MKRTFHQNIYFDTRTQRYWGGTLFTKKTEAEQVAKGTGDKVNPFIATITVKLDTTPTI